MSPFSRWHHPFKAGPSAVPARANHAEGMMQQSLETPGAVDPECLFCRWIRTGTAVETVGTVTAFNDGYPVTEGHLLILPLRHTADWLSMTARELRDSETLIRRLAARIKTADPRISGFNIGTNIGWSAGQTVFHAHIHLIPRRNGDVDNPKGGVRGVIDGRRGY